MANRLKKDKKVAVIGALAEGASIRSVERQTGVHRDTIMRLAVRIGQGCQRLMDAKMRDLPCTDIQCDEIWGFVKKKQKNVKIKDDPSKVGDVYTFVAIDADTKLVPSFKVGKRDRVTADAFMKDLESRLKNRVQLSTDQLQSYKEAVEEGFGGEVDYGQIVKTYTEETAGKSTERKYSPAKVVNVEKTVIHGDPDEDLISTSYVERQNLTMRMHIRRLTRLTNAFSKKWENFKAAVALHFGYYNFVKRHRTLRATPAQAAGIEASRWTVAELIEKAEEA